MTKMEWRRLQICHDDAGEMKVHYLKHCSRGKGNPAFILICNENRQPLRQPAPQPCGQSASQPSSQSATHSASQPASQPAGQPASQPASPPADPPPNPPPSNKPKNAYRWLDLIKICHFPAILHMFLPCGNPKPRMALKMCSKPA